MASRPEIALDKKGFDPKTLASLVAKLVVKKHAILKASVARPYSTLSRPQLAICFMVYLSTSAFTTALFYSNEPRNLAATIVLGILSALVTFPSTFFYQMMYARCRRSTQSSAVRGNKVVPSSAAAPSAWNGETDDFPPRPSTSESAKEIGKSRPPSGQSSRPQTKETSRDALKPSSRPVSRESLKDFTGVGISENRPGSRPGTGGSLKFGRRPSNRVSPVEREETAADMKWVGAAFPIIAAKRAAAHWQAKSRKGFVSTAGNLLFGQKQASTSLAYKFPAHISAFVTLLAITHITFMTYLTVLYALSFPTDLARGWAISTGTSLAQSIFISDPIKIAITSAVFLLLQVAWVKYRSVKVQRSRVAVRVDTKKVEVPIPQIVADSVWVAAIELVAKHCRILREWKFVPPANAGPTPPTAINCVHLGHFSEPSNGSLPGKIWAFYHTYLPKERPAARTQIDGQGRGVIWALGTRLGTKPYSAPPDMSFDSSNASREVEAMVTNRDGRRVFSVIPGTTDKPAWISVDLGSGKAVVATHYSIRHGLDTFEDALAYWEVSGSLDGTTWVQLDQREDQATYSTITSHAVFKIRKPRPARFIRLLVTGRNLSRRYDLSLGAFELFGSLLDVRPASGEVISVMGKTNLWDVPVVPSHPFIDGAGAVNTLPPITMFSCPAAALPAEEKKPSASKTPSRLLSLTRGGARASASLPSTHTGIMTLIGTRNFSGKFISPTRPGGFTTTFGGAVRNNGDLLDTAAEAEAVGLLQPNSWVSFELPRSCGVVLEAFSISSSATGNASWVLEAFSPVSSSWLTLHKGQSGKNETQLIESSPVAYAKLRLRLLSDIPLSFSSFELFGTYVVGVPPPPSPLSEYSPPLPVSEDAEAHAQKADDSVGVSSELFAVREEEEPRPPPTSAVNLIWGGGRETVRHMPNAAPRTLPPLPPLRNTITPPGFVEETSPRAPLSTSPFPGRLFSASPQPIPRRDPVSPESSKSTKEPDEEMTPDLMAFIEKLASVTTDTHNYWQDSSAPAAPAPAPAAGGETVRGVKFAPDQPAAEPGALQSYWSLAHMEVEGDEDEADEEEEEGPRRR